MNSLPLQFSDSSHGVHNRDGVIIRRKSRRVMSMYKNLPLTTASRSHFIALCGIKVGSASHAYLILRPYPVLELEVVTRPQSLTFPKVPSSLRYIR